MTYFTQKKKGTITMKKKTIIVLFGAVCCITLIDVSGCGAHEHSYGERTVTKEATCLENGEVERVCSKCGEKETQEIKAIGHQFSDWKDETPATCTENGTRKRTCSVCGAVEEETTEQTGHKFAAATAFTPKTCEVCGETEGEALATVISEGEEVSSDDHTFTIEDVYYSSKISEKQGNHTLTFGNEGNYLIFKLDFTNLQTEVLENNNTDRFSDIKLVYADKYEYEGDYRLLINNKIVPLGSTNLYIYFAVPETMKDDENSSLYASFKIDGIDYAIVLQDGNGQADDDTASDDENNSTVEIEESVSKGDTRTDDTNFSFVLSDIYYATKISEKQGNHTVSFGTEGSYLILKLDFTNLTTEPLENHSDRIRDISLMYDDKYEYEGDYRLLINDKIVPLANGNVFVYYEVPKDLENMDGSLVATFKVDGIGFSVDCR